MNYPFIAFVVVMIVVISAIVYFLRGAMFSITTVAASHAKTYALAYVKGGALITIAACASFQQAYYALDEAFRSTMPWAPYVIFFSTPITGGLAVFVAFLDRSTQRATEDAEKERIGTGNTNSPFGQPQQPSQ